MLKELRIENLAIIESLELEFIDSFIVLTGETGAGKSIILDGINLLIGEKPSVDMIRDGAEYLTAEGVFEISELQCETLKDMGIEVEDFEIIVRRRFERSGRGKAFVNGRRVPVGNLKEIMGTLVDLVGQHNHQMLLDKDNHIDLVDKFLDKEAYKCKSELETLVERYKKIDKRIKEIKKSKEELKEKKELYEFQLAEIDAVKLVPGEEENLEEEYKKLFNAGKIRENLSSTYHILKENEQNVMSMISSAQKNIDYISKYGKEFEEVVGKFEKAYYEVEEVVYSIENLIQDIDTDEYRLNEVVDRLDKISSLKKKYGFTVGEVISYANRLRDSLDTLDSNNLEEQTLSKEMASVLEAYKDKSAKLSAGRKTVAEDIEKRLIFELKELNMKDAQFKVEFSENDGISIEGKDRLEFLIAPNVGQSLKPLSKIASGGEVSRIMLALKSIFSKVDNIPILIFDEIDTGVGGETVNKVADKLKGIGDNVQVVCITHSPSIASKAKQQFYIEKNSVEGKTVTTVVELDTKARVNEIARMLSGDNMSQTVLDHARELLEKR